VIEGSRNRAVRGRRQEWTGQTMTKDSRKALFSLAVTLALAGCASVTVRDTEAMLAAAGFRAESADMPEALARLNGAPPHRLVPITRDGHLVYVYADPDVCRCIYVGDARQYAAYQRRAAAAQAELEHYTQYPLPGEWND